MSDSHTHEGWWLKLTRATPIRVATLISFAILWGAAVVWLTFAARLTYTMPSVYTGASLAAAALTGLATWVLATTEMWSRGKRLDATLVTLACAVVGGFFAFQLGAGGTFSYLEGSKKRFQQEREAFAKARDGFGALRELAKTQFGLDIELGDVDESWLATTHTGPGSSVAEMGVEPGFCLLSLYPHGVMRSFQPPAGLADGEAVMLRVVVMHEMGHCVDIARDAASFKDPHAVGRSSVAPLDAPAVDDAHTLYLAGRQPATKRWREAFADLFALGYARLTVPAAAPQLTNALIEARLRNPSDVDHATACWLRASINAPAPSSLRDLQAWADRIRSEATCPLQDVKKT